MLAALLTEPNFGYWLTRGTVFLIAICLAFAVLYYIEHYQNESRSEQAIRDAEAKLERARQQRALDQVNAMLPLSASAVRRLSLYRGKQ